MKSNLSVAGTHLCTGFKQSQGTAQAAPAYYLMRLINSVLFFLLLTGKVLTAEARLFEGVLDEKGKIKIEVVLPEKEPFMLQGYLYYRESWRPIRVFWNKAFIWADLGPDYRGLPYRIHLLLP